MSEEVTIKIDRKLANKVRKIAKKKFELRTIKFYSDAITEALIEFVEKNNNLLKKPKSPNSNPKTQTITT
jgi:metal-responsive CopG/Arc/MetJ family transcriptional regulator